MGNTFVLTSSVKEVEEVEKKIKEFDIKENLDIISIEDNKQEQASQSISQKFRNNYLMNYLINFMDIYHHFKPSISAGMASFCQCLLFYWCDLGKNRLQAGLTATMPELLPYNGFRLALIYVVAARSFGFGLFETSKRLLSKSNNFSKFSETNIHILSAAITAIIKPFLLFPIETIKIIMQVKGESFKQAYKTMLILDNKLKAKSLAYLQAKNFVSYFSWFETRKHCKFYFKHKLNNPVSKSMENFLIGSISSMTSFISSSPFSTLKTLRQVGKQEGIKELISRGGKFRLHKGLHFHFMNLVGGGGTFNLVYSFFMEPKAHL